MDARLCNICKKIIDTCDWHRNRYYFNVGTTIDPPSGRTEDIQERIDICDKCIVSECGKEIQEHIQNKYGIK
jgi:hypothetical protein